MTSSLFENYARFCLVAMVVCLSISTAGANIALASFILFALLSQKLFKNFSQIMQSRIVQTALVIFIYLTLSVMWSEADATVAWQWVSKYKKLLLIPLALPFFCEFEHKLFFLKGLFVSLLMGLSVSYLNFFGLLNVGDCPTAGCSTHSYITLSMLNCLLLVIACVFFIQIKTLRTKLFLLTVATAAAVNIALILPSRTGQLMLVVLIVYLSIAFWKVSKFGGHSKKQLFLLCFLALGGLLFSSVFLSQNSRLGDSLQKVSMHKQESFTSTDSAASVDVRFEFYRKTLGLISEKPLLGWGAGGHEPELKRLSEQGVTANERFIFANPHNEYLTWAVQTGLLGLACFLFWLFTVWRHAFKIEDPAHKLIMLGWLLIFTLGNFLNSFLLDFSEGYMTVLLIAVLMPFQSQRPCSSEEK